MVWYVTYSMCCTVTLRDITSCAYRIELVCPRVYPLRRIPFQSSLHAVVGIVLYHTDVNPVISNYDTFGILTAHTHCIDIIPSSVLRNFTHIPLGISCD